MNQVSLVKQDIPKRKKGDYMNLATQPSKVIEYKHEKNRSMIKQNQTRNGPSIDNY